MNPLVIIILMVLALLGLYLLMTELGSSQLSTGTHVSGSVANYSTMAIKILMAIVALYAIYYIVDVIRTSIRERKAKARKVTERASREQSRKF